jgi:hypothetical protein
MINQVNDRMFSNPDDSQAKTLLNALLEEGVSADSYRKTMFKIGQHLGQKLAQSLDPSKKYCVASTVEDADFLAKDSQRDGDTVIPGIGGSVYEKLGYGSQRQKNSILPNLVEAKISAALH